MELLDNYEQIIDEAEGLAGAFAISLVDVPAIMSNFIALSKEEIQLTTIDEDKRLLMGQILVPNKKILRANGDYKYTISFSDKTVREASEIYMRDLRGRNATLQHEVPTNEVALVETWIVEDPKMDKTALYGIEAEKGAWAGTMKVYSDEIWEDVKNGEYNGFSIEGMFKAVEDDPYRSMLHEIKEIMKKA